MTATPLYALLLDVDGPVASPVDRAVTHPGIARDLAWLANAGIPLVFNTGRADTFITGTVVPALREAGISSDAVVFAVCEKGATSFAPSLDGTDDAEGRLIVDERLRLATGIVEYCRSIAPEFADAMFFDATKRAMVSLEANPGIDLSAYRERQAEFEERVWRFLHDQEIGAQWGERRDLNDSDAITVTIDPTIISSDVEHFGAGKHVGAQKALRHLAALDIEPVEFRTLGDSRSDYAMADELHHRGHVVRHGDVRPDDGIPQRPYPVEVSPDPALTNDAAGAAFLARWRKDVECGTPSASFS